MLFVKSAHQNMISGTIYQGDTIFFNNDGFIPIEAHRGGITESILEMIPHNFLENYHTPDTVLKSSFFIYISYDEDYLRLVKNKNMGFNFRTNLFCC